MSALVEVETSGHICRIRFARPHKRNALTIDMYRIMAEAVEAAEADDSVRVISFVGDAECFTAGNDIGDFIRAQQTGDLTAVARFLSSVFSATKIVVAAVAGPAVGIGTTLLLHCDFVIAAPNARLRTPFVDLGLVPEFGSSVLMPLTMGYARAAEMLLLGTEFGADDAKSAGLIHRVVPKDALLEELEALSVKIASRAPSSLRASKKLMRAPLRASVEKAMQEEGAVFLERLMAPEAAEAMMAFMQKRPPSFS